MSANPTIKTIFELRGQTKIKVFAVHPVFNWIGLITTNNVFWLCNYQSNLTIKCFNCSMLDDMKQTEIKDIIFWDRHTTRHLSNSKQVRQRSWILFCSDKKIFLYDYQNYLTKVIGQKDLDYKSIKKIEVVSDDTVCIAQSDGPMKIFDVNQWAIVKTIKGYHSKTVNWIVPYKQNQSEKPRIIATSLDSLMACWNVDIGQSTIETPSFKFLMKKPKAMDSNDGQEIISLRYDPYNFRIITLTEEYVALWSTLSGAEIRRFKNIYNIREIDIFNHLDFQSDSFIGHCRGEQIVISNVNPQEKAAAMTNFQSNVLFSLKMEAQRGQDMKISKIQTLSNQPWLLFINTASGIFVYQINKIFKGMTCHHSAFSTRLSTTNYKQFYNEGVLIPNITPFKLNNIVFKNQEMFNFFYLAYDRGIILLNLIETKIQKMMMTRLQFRMFQVNNPFFRGKIDIVVSCDSSQLCFWTPQSMYYEVYSVMGPTSQLIELDEPNKLDFYSRIEYRFNGLCTNMAWHHHKQELATISPINQQGQLIKYKSNKLELDGKIAGYHICLYAATDKGFELFFVKQIQSEMHFLSAGLYFCYSVVEEQPKQTQPSSPMPKTKKTQRLEFIETEDTTVKIMTPLLYPPLHIYWSETGELAIIVYPKYFTILRADNRGSMFFLKNIQKSIIHGYFWQRLFFFTTASQVFMLHQTLSETILIEIANRCPRRSNFQQQFDLFEQDYVDSLQHRILQMPQGQLRIINIVNLHLYFLDNHNQVSIMPLLNPYVRFCLQVISGCLEQAGNIYDKVDIIVKPYFEEVLKMQEMTAEDLHD